MDIKDLEHPFRLCVEMLYFCCFSCENTQEIKVSETKEKLAFFFGESMVDDAAKLLSGEDVK